MHLTIFIFGNRYKDRLQTFILMTENDVIPLYTRARQKLRGISLRFHRYLYKFINWESRFIGIKGQRGVGKTIMMLQKLLETDPNMEKSLYVSLDDLWFSVNSLPDLVEYLYPRGITTFYLDEVHKYPEWSRVLKNLYDFYPDIHIIYSGSAMLVIDYSVADLSRRQTLYSLNGMSFREFLEYEGVFSMSALTMDELFTRHVAIANEISSDIKVLKYFNEYLRHGYYPFYKENPTEFMPHLAEVVRAVIESDIPSLHEISINTIAKLKTLMMVIAENAPLEPNITRLAERLECSRELCLKMLYLLDNAKLVNILFHHPNSYKQMKGPEKILGGDPNILYALTPTTNIGTIRETFFTNQLSGIGRLTLATHGDYKLDDKFLFEVGGRNKKFNQIADIPDSYLAVDDIEAGFGSRIPLYLFGCLY